MVATISQFLKRNDRPQCACLWIDEVAADLENGNIFSLAVKLISDACARFFHLNNGMTSCIQVMHWSKFDLYFMGNYNM